MLQTLAGHLSSMSRVFSKMRATSAPATPAEPSKGVIELPVVLNSNDEEVSTSLIPLLLDSIFDQYPECVPRIRAQLGNIQNIRTIAAAEEKILGLIRVAEESGSADGAAMRAAFDAHVRRRESNRQSYTTDGKRFPNAVFWPNPTDPARRTSLRTELPFAQRIPIIDKTTAISSAGSCFAVEIAYALQSEGFNYVVKEPNLCPKGTYWFKDHELRPFPTSSAAWGIHFNTPSFLQLVEKAFGYRRPAKILWTNRSSNGQIVYCDPFREELEFPSPEAFEENYDCHLQAVRSVFLESEVLIITLGLNEVWYFRPDGSVFSRSPWRTAPSLVEHCTLTVQQNVDMLQRMLEILRQHNPKLKLIVTLSPVPLHATFLGDSKHVVEANCHSKAILRVAAEEFTQRNEEVYYFPSYELITSCLESPWDEDQRHVAPSAVARVMEMFHAMFSK